MFPQQGSNKLACPALCLKGDRRIAAEQRGVLCQTSEEAAARTAHRVLDVKQHWLRW